MSTLTPRIPTATRFLMARVQDLVLDVNIQGRHEAHLYINGGARRLSYRVVTFPAGKKHGDPEAVSFDAWIHHLWHEKHLKAMGWTPTIAQQVITADLLGMAEHLERLLEEDPS